MRTDTAVRIDLGEATLEADLAMPDSARGVVLFAHGSGSSRHSPRTRMVATRLTQRRFGTLLADLLSAEEGEFDARTGALRFDIPLLARRQARQGLTARPCGCCQSVPRRRDPHRFSCEQSQPHAMARTLL